MAANDINVLLGMKDNNNIDNLKVVCLRNIRTATPVASKFDSTSVGGGVISTVKGLSSTGTMVSASVGIAAIEVAYMLCRKRITGLTPITCMGLASVRGKMNEYVLEVKMQNEGQEDTYIAQINSDRSVITGVRISNDKTGKNIEYHSIQEGVTCGFAIPALILMMYAYYKDAAPGNIGDEIRENLESICTTLKSATWATDGAKLMTPFAVITSALEAAAEKVEKKSKHGYYDSDNSLPVITMSDLETGICLPDKHDRVEGSCFDFLDIEIMASGTYKKMADTSYYIDPDRVLTDEEKALLPELGDEIIIPNFVVDAASTAKDCGFRNFFFEGSPGGGKSVAATILSSMCGLPHVKFTCHAGTTAEDIVGYFVPKTQNLTEKEKDATTDKSAARANLDKISAEDMVYAPVDTYEAITGSKTTPEGKEPTSKDCVDAYTKACMDADIADKLDNGKGEYVLVPSELTLAIIHGWCIEVQEVAAIANPNVLKALNQLYDDSKKLRLVTGEVITRHPDTITVFTGNIGGAGDNEIDSSLRDRFEFCHTVEMPTVNEAVKRALAQTNFPSKELMANMYSVITAMREEVRDDNRWADRIGMRSLINWARMAQKTHDFKQSCTYCVIEKTTSDEDVRQQLVSVYSKYEPILNWPKGLGSVADDVSTRVPRAKAEGENYDI